MNTKNVKELVEEYTYTGLGFPIILTDVLIVEDRGYEYPLINHKEIMSRVACSLVLSSQKLDGARLKFIRRFMNKSLDQFAEIIGDTVKSTVHSWEKNKAKVCPMTDLQLKRVRLSLKTELVAEISKKFDLAMINDIVDEEKIAPLDIEKNSLIAV